MSVQLVCSLAKIFFDLERDELDVIFEDLDRRYFRPFVEAAETFFDEIRSTPELPGYEELLAEKLKYGPLIAKIMMGLLERSSENLAAEINTGRALRKSVDKVASVEGQSALVISRCAKGLKAMCHSPEAEDLIEDAIYKAGLALGVDEFRALVDRTCQRDEAACRELTSLAAALGPHLPEKRGRPISEHTCAHAIVLWRLAAFGQKCAYTSNVDGKGYVDAVSRAGQLASGNGAFSPIHAHRLATTFLTSVVEQRRAVVRT